MPLNEKVNKNERLDRHSASGLRGLAKKEGHASKGGWGKEGTGNDGLPIIDKNDPNYNSDEESDQVILSKVDLASPIEVIIQEYLVSGSIEEAEKNLLGLNATQNHPQFVKKALYIAMDKQAYERELVSKLLSSFYSKVISPKDLLDGFQLALDNLEDISLDIPEATDFLSKFLARAVVDEIIPPIFLSQAHSSNPKANSSLNLATALSTENHGGERLAHIWGPGDLHSVKRLKAEVQTQLEEFLLNGDKAEAERSVRKLNAPSFHFQIVKQALRLMLEKTPAEQRKIMNLLKYFNEVALISSDYMAKGFNCCFSALDDIKLDVPNAATQLGEFVDTAKNENWLAQSYVPVSSSSTSSSPSSSPSSSASSVPLPSSSPSAPSIASTPAAIIS